jgi:hypothetical protein
MKHYFKEIFQNRFKLTANQLTVSFLILFGVMAFSGFFECPIPKNTFENLDEMELDRQFPGKRFMGKKLLPHRWVRHLQHGPIQPRRSFL